MNTQIELPFSVGESFEARACARNRVRLDLTRIVNLVEPLLPFSPQNDGQAAGLPSDRVIGSIGAYMKRVATYLFLIFTPQILTAATGYLVHNLVADASSTATADFYDLRLVNPWGVSVSGTIDGAGAPATSPLWLCDGGTGLASNYTVNPTSANADGLGSPNATPQPAVPGAGGNPKGVCTGIVANTGPSLYNPLPFPVTTPGKDPVAASFIFVTQDGALSAWSEDINATQAFVQVDNSSSAVYTGLAFLGTTTAQLYAANFKAGTIDTFGADFHQLILGSAFKDPRIPVGFAPFNIWPINGKLYVTYAKQDASRQFDVAGPGNGYVDVYDVSGKLLQSLIAGESSIFGAPPAPLNSPWGLALAPPTFGKYANALLVGNFGDGTINAFDPSTGAFLGTLQDRNGQTIVIPGLRALVFGNGMNGGDKNTLYFTAGPGGGMHGILGSISADPITNTASITNAAQSGAGIAANTWITIVGTGLAATKRSWMAEDFGTSGTTLPTSLDGVRVTLNGEPGYISYVSPTQINLLTPAFLSPGGASQVDVVVSNNGLTSATASTGVEIVAPSFFLADITGHIAATHGDYTLISSTAPATPGETIILYGNGFGATTPAITKGQAQSKVAPLVILPTITFNGNPATIEFGGLTGTGLYQFNVTVPAGLTDGDAAVTAMLFGMSSPGALITIKN